MPRPPPFLASIVPDLRLMSWNSGLDFRDPAGWGRREDSVPLNERVPASCDKAKAIKK